MILRIRLMQKWCSLSGPAMEGLLIEMPIIRRWMGIDMFRDRTPVATTSWRSGISWRTTTSTRRSLRRSRLISRKGNDQKGRYDHRCHLDRGAQLHQKRGRQAESGDALEKVLRLCVAMRLGKHRALLATPEGRMKDLIETVNTYISAKAQYPIRLIKQDLGFQKMRLRDTLRNRCKVNALAARIFGPGVSTVSFENMCREMAGPN